MNYCETCKFYLHTPNILGGIAECILAEKRLTTFWKNEACDKYQHTDIDKLKPQNEYYKKHLSGILKLDAK